jgi:ApaG protein
MSQSETVTDGVRVQVEAHYSPEHSQPQSNQWFFLYTIRISNEGEETCQLVSRHWIIRNASGEMDEVRGPGVVGEQPVLEPGDSFEYTSGCPLDTPFGSMEGTYQMVTENGSFFDVAIARFDLREPGAIH